MVSVIIPTSIGGMMHLATLMPNLSQEPESEVIIIDNASKDGTANYLSNFECTLKINKYPMNFSKSNNYGASIARGEYLLFLNNDTLITNGFIKEMVRVFEQNPEVAVVGNLLLTMGQPRKVSHAGVCFTQNYIPYELGPEMSSITPGIPMNDPRVSSVREVPSVTGACAMINRDIFNNIGGFDEDYVNGWEDNDLFLKVRELGFKIWYTGKVPVYHKKHGSRGRFNFESANRKRYDEIWINSGRAEKALKGVRES